MKNCHCCDATHNESGDYCTMCDGCPGNCDSAMSNEYKTHKLTHEGTNTACKWCFDDYDQAAEHEEGLQAELDELERDNTINIEPSWVNLAELAISMLQDSNENTVASGKLIIRDMAEKLARVRANQPDCPAHLKNVVSAR